jgi:acyl-CoA synthetase (NDP forming)
MSAHTHSLHSLLWPESVAVIGASPDVAKIRGRLLAFLVANGYAGKILPINPSHREILGLPCLPSIAAAAQQAGGKVDVALIAIPAETVLPELERCAAAGVRHAVIISSGFAEEGGESAQIQQRITELTQRTGMRVSGPNAEGYYNAVLSLAATFSPTLADRPADTPRVSRNRIGIAAQSGGVGFALFQQGRRAGLDFSYVVTTGNEADIGIAELVEYMVEDDSTKVIFLYVESIRDAARFERAALRARSAGKHIVTVKIGRSESGSRAAASHTAAMAGWNVAFDALFARCGVHQALDMEEALAMCALLAACPKPAGNRIAVVTASGGAGAWAGDTIERLGGRVPLLSAPLQARIREHIPSYGGPANPVDVTAQALRNGGMLRIVDMLMDSDEVDAVLVVTSLAVKHFFYDKEMLKRLAASQRKPFLFYTFSIPTEEALTALAECSVPATVNLPGTCSALLKLAEPAPRGYVDRTTPPALSAPAKTTLAGAADVLCEYEVKDILAQYGVSASRELLAKSEAEAVAAAAKLGTPVAMKVQSPLLPHKTEIGGVRLNLRSEVDVRDAWQALVAAAEKHSDKKALRGILVQGMAAKGHELIIGTVRDPAVGPLVLVGFGGVAVELYRDVVYRMAPVTPEGARDMLDALKSAALLKGFRGQPAIDVEPLCRLIADVSRIAWELSEAVDEFELNPVIVHADNSGLTIADALMRKRRIDGGHQP